MEKYQQEVLHCAVCTDDDKYDRKVYIFSWVVQGNHAAHTVSTVSNLRCSITSLSRSVTWDLWVLTIQNNNNNKKNYMFTCVTENLILDLAAFMCVFSPDTLNIATRGLVVVSSV